MILAKVVRLLKDFIYHIYFVKVFFPLLFIFCLTANTNSSCRGPCALKLLRIKSLDFKVHQSPLISGEYIKKPTWKRKSNSCLRALEANISKLFYDLRFFNVRYIRPAETCVNFLEVIKFHLPALTDVKSSYIDKSETLCSLRPVHTEVWKLPPSQSIPG